MMHKLTLLARVFLVGIILAFGAPRSAHAADCYESTIVAPSPFMGNNDEIFQLADGSIWQVKYEYEYLYEYQPKIVICPSRGVLAIKGKALNVVPIRNTRSPAYPSRQAAPPVNGVTVVYRPRGCDYFVAHGPQGYYVLEWYGGHDPVVGDTIAGYESGYGFKDVIYVESGAQGRIYVEGYLLSKDRAAEKIAEKCS